MVTGYYCDSVAQTPPRHGWKTDYPEGHRYHPAPAAVLLSSRDLDEIREARAMDQLRQAMTTMDQGGTGPLALKIKARTVFSAEEWTKTIQDLPAEQRGAQKAALGKTLADETVKVLTWDSWDQSFKPFTQTWPFVKWAAKPS